MLRTVSDVRRFLLSKRNRWRALSCKFLKHPLHFLMMLVSLLFVFLLAYSPLCKGWLGQFSSADTGDEYAFGSWDYLESWPGYNVKEVASPIADLPIIIWWTDGGSLSPHGSDEYTHLTCPNGAACYSTTKRDQTLMKDYRTRGFLFYGTDVDPFDLPLPRLKHHEWALIHEESPLNNYLLVHHAMIRLFNHTSTFRRESDYPLSTQAIHHADYLISRKPVTTTEKNEEKRKRSLAPVVYVQSHCDVPSDRDSYVKELMKYIDVDSYGTCLHNKDLPEKLQNPAETFEHKDFLELMSVYKFNIAFENAYCNDYMTEKIMRPLHIGVVPIYKGSPVVQDWMPNNHSVILADNFESPKELAEFIRYLDENDEEYEKYLEFKRTEIPNKFLLDHMQKREWSDGLRDFFRGYECHVCKQLVTRMEVEKAHAENPASPLLPPRIANSSHLGCPTPERLDIGYGMNDVWPDIDWTSLYWDGVDRARAVQSMLEAGETDSQNFQKYHNDELMKHHSRAN